jgi:hypothetical protein
MDIGCKRIIAHRLEQIEKLRTKMNTPARLVLPASATKQERGVKRGQEGSSLRLVLIWAIISEARKEYWQRA